MKKVILNPKKVKYDGTSFEVVFKNDQEVLKKFKKLQKQIKKQVNRNESQSKKTTP